MGAVSALNEGANPGVAQAPPPADWLISNGALAMLFGASPDAADHGVSSEVRV